MAYHSCYIAPLKKSDIDAYRSTSEETTTVFKEMGALNVVEFVSSGDVPADMTALSAVIHCETDEVTLFGWVSWPSKAEFDNCNAELQRAPRSIHSLVNFDVQRRVAFARNADF